MSAKTKSARPRTRQCGQCGLWDADMKVADVARWAHDKANCPRCQASWRRPMTPVAHTPTCAGCGRKTAALKGDTCKRCADKGVEVQALF